MIKRKQKYRILFVVVFGFLLGCELLGADFYSTRNGNWNVRVTWSLTPGGPMAPRKPAAGDIVYIESGHTVTVRQNEACSSITFTGDGSVLSISANRTLSVSGLITLNKQSAANTGCTIAGNGSLTCLGVEVGSSTNSPSGQFSSYTHTISSTVANWIISGNLNINNYFSLLVNLRNGIFNLESGIVTLVGQISGNNAIALNTSTFSMDAGIGDGTLILQDADPFDLDL